MALTVHLTPMLLLGGSLLAAGSAAGPSSSLHAPIPITARLSNGLTVLILPRGQAPWCAMATVLPGGSRMDPPGKSGLAHLAEHLLFVEAGTAGPSRADLKGESLGVASNAFTLPDYTVVVDEFSPAVIRQAVEVHAMRLRGVTFTEAQLAREKGVVADERRFRVDEPPLGRAEESALALMWGDVREGRPVLGWPADVGSIAQADVAAWLARTVRPSGAVTAVVGAVDPVSVLAAMSGTLDLWGSSAAAVTAQRAAPMVPPPPRGRRAKDLPAAVAAAVVALPGPARGSADEAADQVLARLLEILAHRSMTNPEGASVQLSVDVRPGLGGGETVITIMPREDQDPAEVEASLDALLGRVGERSLEGAWVGMARRRAQVDLPRDLSLHVAMAERLAVDQALLRRATAWTELEAALAAVGRGEVQRRARAWLSPRTARGVVQARPAQGDEP